MPFTSEQLRHAVGYFVPVELQRRNIHVDPNFEELAFRGLSPTAHGFQQIQPWCKWRSITTYLDCIAFADSTVEQLPTGDDLNLEHITPGRFYAAGIIFFAQAMLDNIAVWLCESLPLKVNGGERNFQKKLFRRELTKNYSSSGKLLTLHDNFVGEINRYRQVWIHTLAGGVIPVADENPFEYPEQAGKMLGVPIDPAINPDEPSYLKRVALCAVQNEGCYLFPLKDFTARIFGGSLRFYLDWLQFALQVVGVPKVSET